MAVGSLARAAILFAGLAAAFAAWRLAAPAAAPPDPRDVLEATDGRRWVRGNLHAHTRWSDGLADAGTVAAWYRDAGYDFLAITDHDVVPDDAAWAALEAANDRPDRFLLIRGEEISNHVGGASVHLNALGIDRPLPRVEAGDVVSSIERTAIAVAARARPGTAPLLQLNHPNGWWSVTAEDLLRQHGVGVFEVFNAHELGYSGGDGLRPPVERLWDVALAWRLDVLGLPLLYGTATDDSHARPGDAGAAARPGRAWVQVLVERLDAPHVLGALRRGRFYASTGVELERVVASPTRLAVVVVPEPGVDHVIEFVGTRRGFDTASSATTGGTGRALQASRRHDPAIGRVFERVAGSRAEYVFQPDDLYVRARITSTRRHPDPSVPLQFEQAWVQPVVGPAGRAPNRPHAALPEPIAPATHVRSQQFALLPAAVTRRLLGVRGAACALDLVADADGRASGTLARSGRVTLGGWLLDPAADGPPDSMSVLLSGAAIYGIDAGLP